MNKLQSQVKEFMVKAGQECLVGPTIPDYKTRELRVRLLLEEVLEFARASSVNVADQWSDCEELDMDNLRFKENTRASPDLIECIDGIGDILVVAAGASCAFGIDDEPFTDEIMLNNMTKFDGGYKDENGKFRKGPNYKLVDLKPLIEAQYAKRTATTDSPAHQSEVQTEFDF